VTVERRLKNNTATIESSMQMAKEKLLRAVHSGATGLITIKAVFQDGGVRNLTVGEELVVKQPREKK
jgi:hypothetical protein